MISISLLEEGQIDFAEKEKARIERIQRSRSVSRSSPKWFKQNHNSYTLIRDEDSLHYYWKQREENWLGVQFLHLW